MDDKSLVQDEGVDAGSKAGQAEPDQPADPRSSDDEAVRAGGRPGSTDAQPHVEDLEPSGSGGSGEKDSYPGGPAESAGQDAGSID